MNLKKKLRRRRQHERAIWRKRHGGLVGEVLRQEVLNVVPIAGIRQAMGTTALNAFLQMRRAGQKDIRVSIQSDGNSAEYNAGTVALQMHKRWMQMANQCAVLMKPPSEMTQEEKFAICVAAKVPLWPGSGHNDLVWKLQTLHPCAIVIEDGQYVVYQLPQRDQRISRLSGESKSAKGSAAAKEPFNALDLEKAW